MEELEMMRLRAERLTKERPVLLEEAEAVPESRASRARARAMRGELGLMASRGRRKGERCCSG